MSLSIAGAFLTAFVVCIIIMPRTVEKKLIAIFSTNIIFEAFINVGYYAKINDVYYDPSDFLQIILVALSIPLILKRRKINTTYVKCFIVLGSVVGLNLFLLKFFPYEGYVRDFSALDRISAEWYSLPTLNIQSFKSSLRIMVFFYNIFIFLQVVDFRYWETIRRRIIKCGVALILFGWFEFVIKNMFMNSFLKKVIDFIFGKTIDEDMMLLRNEYYTVHGLNNEPSQFAMTLFYFIVFYIISCDSIKERKFVKMMVWSGIPLLFLSGSFRFIGLLPGIMLVFMINEGVKTKVIISASFLLTGSFVLYFLGYFDYLIGRLINLLSFTNTGVLDLTSETSRFNTVAEAFLVFLENPFFGTGLGTTFAYGFLPSILATMGITGTITWYVLMFKKVSNLRLTSKYSAVILVLSLIWIYTSAIDIVYSIIVFSIALEIRMININANQWHNRESEVIR